MRREAVAELSPIRIRGARDRLRLRHAEIVFRFDVAAFDYSTLDGAGNWFVLRFELDLDGLIAVAVDHVQNQRAVVVPGGRAQVWCKTEPLALVFRAFHKQIERAAAGVLREELEGVIDRLR